MNWVRKHNLSAMDVIKFNSLPYNHLDNLWNVLYQSYNSTQNYFINPYILNRILLCQQIEWPSFSITELKNAVINAVVHLL